MATTTVKVQKTTRDEVIALGLKDRQSADQVIREALDALRRDRRRRVAAAEARAIAEDPADLAEIRAIREDAAYLHEG